MKVPGILAITIVLSLSILATGCQKATEPAAASATNSGSFDSHDFTGIWSRFGPRADRGSVQGGAPFPEAGDAGFGNDVPPFTPEGQKMFEAIKPGNGRLIDSPDAAAHPEEHIGRRRAVPGKLQNDPTAQCTPSGLTRALLITYAAPLEIIHAKDRIIQHVEWYNEWREIYTDGRQLPKEPNIPRWNGFSVGRWEGDTFIVNSSGFEQNSWVDHFGYPHSDQMKLEERYRRIAPDRLELTMTLTDPKVYTAPWVSQRKVFRLMPKDELLLEDGWPGIFEQRCVPEEEFAFNENIRNRSGGNSAK
jgi:hypothetical protein